MESDTFRLWLASDCQIGGSFGFTAKDFAAVNMLHDPSIIHLAELVIGS